MSLREEIDDLFANAMKGKWDEVLKIYKRSPAVQKAKITKSEDTTLHTAVSVGQTDTALKLVEICEKDILKLADAKGNTALHIAAALGDLRVLMTMISKDPDLINSRNLIGETPLFLAARHGKIEAFAYLHSRSERDDLVRRNDGDTILHVAISGEYFSLAMSIMHYHPNLADSMNENGLSPLHILASKPNAFQSSNRFGLFDRIIYHCLVVDDIEESLDIDAYIQKETRKGSYKETLKYPENYKTCINFFGLLSRVFQVIFIKLGFREKQKDGKSDLENPQQKSSTEQGKQVASSSALGSKSKGATNEVLTDTSSTPSQDKGKEEKLVRKTGTEENPQTIGESQGTKQLRVKIPPNYETLVLFLNVMVKALLIILGIGLWRIKKIQRKKKLHMWAKRVMDELVKHTTSYKFYDNTGWDPSQTREGGLLGEEFAFPGDIAAMSDEGKSLNTSSSFKSDLKVVKDQNESDKRQTPILIAAKMGLTEMVEKILEAFPVAIQDVDSDNKNVVLLAVENRQPQVYNLLLHRKIPKENVFRQLDKDGNSALHLAAQCKEQRPWLIPGVALQMQWEIKWYNFVKKSMPPQFFPRYNAKHETPKEIFRATHKDLTKEGGKWLVKTAESCSVVAALVATVAFATSATIPGGVNEETGIPILQMKPAFGAFAISSLVALCFSVTSLVFFLSILTSRCQEEDFAMDLPRKLLLGLTSLFASIASVVVSFCEGHIFILSDKLKYAAYPLYATLCFPITYFALAQLSLYFDLVWAIIKKIPQRCN